MRLKRFEQLTAMGDKATATKKEIRQMQEVVDGNFKTKDILKLTVSELVDAEHYLIDFQYSEFCRIFVKRNWLKPIRVCHLQAIATDFKKQKDELIERFVWVFNPPQYGEPPKESPGNELRKDFVNEFGNYVVLTDMLISKMGVTYLEIEKWNVESFFFWANYYSGQKIIENVK